ncbi:MAG: TrmH family RNA methyltransferase [Thermodesulfobacteriota bacterium]
MHQLLVPFEQFIETISPSPEVSVVVLGGVQDPHNVGAIIRSAAGFGASAVIIPEHGNASITGAVIKVSAGMAFRIPLVSAPLPGVTSFPVKSKITIGWPPPVSPAPPAAVASSSIG